MIFNLKRNLLALALFSCGAALVGCSSSAKPAATGETNKAVATIEKTDKQPSSPTNRDTPTDSIAASGDKIGVPECDDYIEKYEACVTGKVPEATRAMIRSSFEQTRKQWKDLAANPQTKSSLASICKQSKDMAKQSMGAYHCDW